MDFTGIIAIIGMIGGAVAVYTGIRNDLVTAVSKAEFALDSANKAHERIDKLLEA